MEIHATATKIIGLTSGCSGQASTLAADPSVGQLNKMNKIKYIAVLISFVFTCYGINETNNFFIYNSTGKTILYMELECKSNNIIYKGIIISNIKPRSIIEYKIKSMNSYKYKLPLKIKFIFQNENNYKYDFEISRNTFNSYITNISININMNEYKNPVASITMLRTNEDPLMYNIIEINKKKAGQQAGGAEK